MAAGTRLIAHRELPHPGAQFTIFDEHGYRYTCFITDQTDDDIAALEMRHRQRARVEDCIRNGKDTGMCNLPHHAFAHNHPPRLGLRLAEAPLSGQDLLMRGFVAPTDHGWYQFLRARPEISEVNFWRPGGVEFRAIPPGAPFFFKLKSPHNAIGGFGLIAWAERLPVWRAWDVFGQANGTRDEHELLLRLDRLGGRDRLGLGRSRMIGCVAITEPVFFAPDEWVAVPNNWSRNIVSGRSEDLSSGEGLRMWMDCLERAAAKRDLAPVWPVEAFDAQRGGKPLLITPRLGQASFRLAVLDAYGQQCAVTTEHSLPVIDVAHIRPWAAGGAHAIPNGVPLRRDLHRLFDLGYVTIRPTMHLAVSRKLRDDYANGRVYYELDGRQIRLPDCDDHRPDVDALAWHEAEVFLGS